MQHEHFVTKESVVSGVGREFFGIIVHSRLNSGYTLSYRREGGAPSPLNLPHKLLVHCKRTKNSWWGEAGELQWLRRFTFRLKPRWLTERREVRCHTALPWNCIFRTRLLKHWTVSSIFQASNRCLIHETWEKGETGRDTPHNEEATEHLFGVIIYLI